jgi:hypothetical protein
MKSIDPRIAKELTEGLVENRAAHIWKKPEPLQGSDAVVEYYIEHGCVHKTSERFEKRVNNIIKILEDNGVI